MIFSIDKKECVCKQDCRNRKPESEIQTMDSIPVTARAAALNDLINNVFMEAQLLIPGNPCGPTVAVSNFGRVMEPHKETIKAALIQPDKKELIDLIEVANMNIHAILANKNIGPNEMYLLGLSNKWLNETLEKLRKNRNPR